MGLGQQIARSVNTRLLLGSVADVPYLKVRYCSWCTLSMTVCSVQLLPIQNKPQTTALDKPWASRKTLAMTDAFNLHMAGQATSKSLSASSSVGPTPCV